MGDRPAVSRARGAIAPVILLVAAIVIAAGAASAHGEEVDIVVEAIARGGDDLGVVDYGISLTYIDGDPVTDAEVVITAVPDDGVQSDPVTATVPGVYIGRLIMPISGEWRVTVSFDHPETSGSVEFTQPIRDPAPSAPVVMVDTLQPERVGTVAAAETSILGPETAEAAVIGEHAGAVVVEAFIAEATDPLRIEYAATITDPDGAPIGGAVATISGVSDAGATTGPTVLSDESGIHRTTVTYPSGGLWTLTMDLALPSGAETLEFKENLPWPHYTTEAGHPKVKYDNLSPDRIGTLASAESVYLSGGEASEAAPSTTKPDATVTTTGEAISGAVDEVVLALPSTSDALRQDVGLRLLHLVAIALWAVPMFAAGLGKSYRFTVPAALVGTVLTVVSGILLVAWGAPLSYPGLLRWTELQERFYGPSYSAAFVAKMVAVAIAAAATLVWALRRSRTAAWLTLGAMAGALVAVTAMSQFHLFSHL